MMNKTGLWSGWCAGVVLAFVGGCTKPNPLNCSDGSCTDPSLPFCDVDGSLGGEANTCIAVACTPDSFAACRGDLAITCNALGNNYDELRCNKGCEPNIGCRVCDPGQTVCANGQVQTCDANGEVVASQDCPLGCFEDQPRCRDIDPSNGLAMFLDMTSNPSDLDLSAGGIINLSTGVVIDDKGRAVAATTHLTTQSNGVPLRVVVAKRVRLGNVQAYGEEPVGKRPALAIIATDKITVEGTLAVDSGSLHLNGCDGGQSVYSDSLQGGLRAFAGASGGGANATDGGTGGDAPPDGSGGIAGVAIGTQALVPLQGGCAGGVVIANGVSTQEFLPGGGAVQLSSRVAVEVTGTINEAGADGFEDQVGNGGVVAFGAGAGGAILIEAPTVTLGASAKLLAGGGNGKGCNPAKPFCGAGGVGATVDHPAGNGGDSQNGTGPINMEGGSGGGGLGRERINTPDRTYSRSSGTVEVADVTTGTLSTR